MTAHRMYTRFGRFLAVLLAGAALYASEHHGVVQSGGLPVPGATVTATQGDKKFVTTTDDQGTYSFANLPDGTWTITVEMLGFAKLSEEVGVAAMAPSPTWNLKLLSPAEVKSAVEALKSPAAPAPATVSAQAPAAAAPKNDGTPNGTATASAQPSNPAAAAPAGGRSGRGGQGGNGGRPSLRGALAQNGQGGRGGQNGNGFQRVDVNAADGAAAAADGSQDIGMSAGDAAQNANDAFVVGGSISSGVAMPQQNDWFGGRGGPGGPMGFGMGGPGMGGPGMDGMQQPGMEGGGPQMAGGGRGGPGGGGFGGGRGGFGGGPGGRGGFGGPGGGRGDRAGRGPGGRNPNAFGNGRRDARMRYNGNLGIIYNNSALNARQFSLTGQDTPKPSTANARMTAMFGGPLKIPHLLSGQKTFFTINYQFTRARTGSVSTSLVPTADERAGNFANVFNLQGQPVTILDPTTGAPFPNNQIPANRISSQALGLLAFYPLPNFGGNSRYNYQTALVGINNQDNVNTRISHTINTKNQVNGNFSYQRQDGTSPNLFGFVDGSHQSAYNTGVGWTYHFTTHLFNQANLNFSRNTQTSTPYFANRLNISGQLGITGNDQDPNFWGPPSLGFANGFAGLSDANLVYNRSQTTSFGDSVRWFRGKHNFTFGGDIRRLQNNPISQQNPRGSFNFTGGLTGYDFSDFLLGLPYTSQIAYGNADKYFRNGWFDLYATDDWRLSTKVSLNLGLRWEYQLPTTELYGRLVNLNIAPGFASASVVCATTTVTGCTPYNQAGFTKSLMNGDAREFQPRIGIAWRATNNTRVDGGYGVYFNTTTYQSIINQMAQQSPLSYSLIDSAASVPLTLANGFPLVTKTPITTFAVDSNFRIGYVHTARASVQQTLKWGLVGTVTYTMAKGTHQMQEFIPNSAAPGVTVPAGWSSAYCPTCPTNFTYMTTGGNSIMNAVWLQLQRRFRGGFAGNLVYAHTNMIDDGATGGRGAGASIAQNWLDLNAERARSAGVRANTLNANFQYSTGMGARGGALLKGFKGKLLRDWTISNAFVVQSGAPETPAVISKVLGGTGIVGPLRAEYTGLPVYLPDGTLNPAAFAVPAAGTYGNAGRDIITGPMTFTMNSSASRVIRVGERRSFDFRIDSVNPLNHVVFTAWNTTVNSTQFGLPSGVSPMRSLTATLRFRF
ncbi:MAG TPA: carboxypeptidase regulatory-like domain-containing protein [Bryobacteraceae bacterium]|nr:carboxypeptidase regulatory-like domain-containing protein [Bryobacteraceae bacterium]